MIFDEPKITIEEIFSKIYNTEPQTLKEKEMFVKWFFLEDRSSRNHKIKSGVEYCWHLVILAFKLLEKLQRSCTEVWNDVNLKLLDIRKSGLICRIISSIEFKKC